MIFYNSFIAKSIPHFYTFRTYFAKMYLEFSNYISRICLGHIPPFIQSLLESLNKTGIYEENDGFDSNKISLVTATIDLANSIPQDIRDELVCKWNELSKDEIESVKETNRLFWTSLYLEIIDDDSYPISRKLEFIERVIKMTEAVMLYSNGVEVMTAQQDFFKRVKRDRKKIGKKLKNIEKEGWIEIAIEDSIHKGTRHAKSDESNTAAEKPIKLSNLWKHGEAKLRALSVALYEDGYTEAIDSFSNVFAEKSKKKTEWLKSKTTLLFLFNLTCQVNETIPDLVLNLICTRMLCKGKPIANRVLRTQLKQIAHIFDVPPNKLRYSYYNLYEIYRTIL